MPGFGFSERPAQRLARRRACRSSGSRRCSVSATRASRRRRRRRRRSRRPRLGQRHPDAVAGVHVANVYGSIEDGDVPRPGRSRNTSRGRSAGSERRAPTVELQATRPQDPAGFALDDSPSQACRMDRREVPRMVRLRRRRRTGLHEGRAADQNITIYWARRTAASSLRPYWDRATTRTGRAGRGSASPAGWRCSRDDSRSAERVRRAVLRCGAGRRSAAGRGHFRGVSSSRTFSRRTSVRSSATCARIERRRDDRFATLTAFLNTRDERVFGEHAHKPVEERDLLGRPSTSRIGLPRRGSQRRRRGSPRTTSRSPAGSATRCATFSPDVVPAGATLRRWPPSSR